MAYPKKELEIIAEMDNEETGEHTCWAIRSEFDRGSNRYHYLWITKYDDECYIVEDSEGHNRAHNRTYKTLWGAQRMAEEIMWRQEESGYFTD